MKKYDHSKIEKRWQKIWEKKKAFRAEDISEKPKFYALIEFPFPSGDGMHTGHLLSNTAMDIIARKRRAEGHNVLYPIGWDAFGLPTENYALKTGQSPAVVTKKNTDNFRKQLKSAGFSFDWSREINTTDPEYYKWTQWIFLKMFEKGLAYKKKILVNWCPKDKTGLANEEVIDGKCERCGTPVERREKEQWMLAITKYAERLDKDLDTVNYLEKIKTQQRNWIGASEGAEIDFEVKDMAEKISVFTTRPDTLFGVTYVVLAPEHELVQKLKSQIQNWDEVEAYIHEVKKREEKDRMADDKEKTGVELKGVLAINPANSERVPIYIADYVLASYGTGAVMAVPAHDERDFTFAKKYGLPIWNVVIPRLIDKTNPHVEGKEIVFRDAVIAVIRNPKTDKYLCLKWKKQPWTTFVMGGIERGEDALTSALREIQEETGYKNVKFIRNLGMAQSEFYAAHKDVNRVAHTRSLLFELIDEERDELSKEESEIHELEWRSFNEITADTMTHSELPLILEGIKHEPTAFTGSGILINSSMFNGLSSDDVKRKITDAVGGRWKKVYKLRDWVFSRQRYWGEPIPMVYCEQCAGTHVKEGRAENVGWVPVTEKELPIELPKIKKYQPNDSGESPLADITKWVHTKCPVCRGPARRETDTMPNWAGSSWYFLRYIDPKNKKAFADRKKLEYFQPVDWYNGGMEHTTLHLLYSRFWNKFLFDIGVVPTSEPYMKRTSHGMILAPDGEKMSKSRGNVVNPDQIIKDFGADTLRMYEMFMGPFDQAVAWSMDGIVGPRRFLERVWKLGERLTSRTGEARDLSAGKRSETHRAGSGLEIALHKTIKKISDDIESMQFNTAISALMILVNDFEKTERLDQKSYEILIKLLSPFAPHIAEELWSLLGHKSSIHTEPWPAHDEKKLISTEVTIIVQVNGKMRGEFTAERGLSEEMAKNKAFSLESVAKWAKESDIKKLIYVKDKLINIVV